MGPLLFVIYINYMEENVGSLKSKFAEGTKLDGDVDSVEGCQRLQSE